MEGSNVNAWERLERSKAEIETILSLTKKGSSFSTEDETWMHQELLIAVGAIANFSECLAKGELHE